MNSLLIVLLAITANTGSDRRIAQETNRAPDVVAPYPERTPAAVPAAPQSTTQEAAKANDDRSAAETKIRLQYAQISRIQMALAQANGEIETLKDRLDKERQEQDGLWKERLDLEIDFAVVKETEKSAKSELENQRAENNEINKKLDAMTAWNRKLIAQHFIIVILIPLGFLLYFALRRQNFAILARLPSEEKERVIRRLHQQIEEMKREHIEGADRLKAEMHTLKLDGEAARKNADENAAKVAELEHDLEEKTRLADAQGEDIQRLVRLQQGSEATIARMTEESLGLVNEIAVLRERLADEQTLASLGNGSKMAHEPTEKEALEEHHELVHTLISHVKAGMADDPAAPPPPLSADLDIAAAHSAAINAIEISRASLHEVDRSNASPRADAVPKPADADGDTTRKIEDPKTADEPR